MQQGQMQKYLQISKLYKSIVQAFTTFQLPQLKLYLVTLQQRIIAKAQPVLSQYLSSKELLDNFKEAKGKVPIHYASTRGDIDILKYLIEQAKLDHKIKDKEGNNCFFIAIDHGHLALVQYFVEELNSSPNETKEGEISTLHIAANHNHCNILTYLIGKGADLQKVSIYGKPINWAVGGRNLEAAKVLLDHGASPDGDTSGTNVAPLILAVDCKDHEIYHLLAGKGANIHVKDPNGYTVLHLAAEKGDLQIVKDLVQRGVDINLQVEGKTPLYLAFEHSQWEVVNYLRKIMPNHQNVEDKWKEETEKLKQSIIEPNHEKAEEIKLIGNKFYTAKQYQQALQEYLKALTFDQTNEIIHRNIAACHLALKNYELALFHCQQAKKKDSKNVKTLYRESQAYIGLGNLIQASASMWQCSLLEPHNQSFKVEFHKLVQSAKQQHKASKPTQ